MTFVNRSTSANSTATWRQGEVIDLEIVDLNDRGDGVGRWQERVVFVPDTAIGDQVQVRLMQVKRSFANAKLLSIVQPSPDRQRPACIVADKCGGCQWQHVKYDDGQLNAKRQQVIQALQRIGGFGVDLGAGEQPRALSDIGSSNKSNLGSSPELSTESSAPSSTELSAESSLEPSAESSIEITGSSAASNLGMTAIVKPILTTGQALRYRNKVTYPVDRSPEGQTRAGYYQQGTHKIVNLNQCPVQHEAFDAILQQVKRDIDARGWSLYNEQYHSGEIRHLGLRVGRNTGEMLLTLVTLSGKLKGLEEQAQLWLEQFPGLVGVTININPKKTNVIFGAETYTVAGSGVLQERFAGLTLELGADTFFQVNTEAAELLVQALLEGLALDAGAVVLDAYCGIGTLTLPIARQVQQAIGIEVHEASIDRAEANAIANDISNASFYAGRVEDRLFQVAHDRLDGQVDAVVLDPPRQGCDPVVIDALRRLKPKRIAYVSCKPATLARDLKLLCEQDWFTLDYVQPIDLFPQTAHIESIAFLTLNPAAIAATETIRVVAE